MYEVPTVCQNTLFHPLKQYYYIVTINYKETGTAFINSYLSHYGKNTLKARVVLCSFIKFKSFHIYIQTSF